jgi:paraquat-inducible protein A
MSIVGCQMCGLTMRLTADDSGKIRCPRCSSPLAYRRAGDVATSSAFLLAAWACYIPANLLPVMEHRGLWQSNDASTLLTGVIELCHDQSHGLAALVFLVSIVMPCAKFLALGCLLVSVKRGSTWARPLRSRIYRFLKRMSYWSMLDVGVIGWAACLVQFQAIGTITPRAGIFFFAASVILTMLATTNFDARLIWDDPRDPISE